MSDMQSSANDYSWGRYEAKYIIGEAQALEVRNYCLAHLPPDPHTDASARRQYPILSVYLDSQGRDLFRDAVERSHDRFKLRVRKYHSCHCPSDQGPTFLEIKRKTNGLVRKYRALVPARTADGILWNDGAGDATSLPANAGESLLQFLELRRQFQAAPTVGVAYMREAYQGVSNERLRITLDRHLHFGILAQPGRGRDQWWPVHTGGVILEVKFTDTYPCWVMHMLHRAEVIRRGVCKYVICAKAAGDSPGSLRRYGGV